MSFLKPKPMVIRVTINDPQPWQRPRATSVPSKMPGKKAKVRFYNPTDTKVHSYKLDIGNRVKIARPAGWPMEVGYQVDLLFVLARDLAPADYLPPTGPRKIMIHKPDKDNLTKAVYDALKNIAWIDDAQVCDGREVKVYAASDERAHAVIVIRPKNPDELPGLDTMF